MKRIVLAIIVAISALICMRGETTNPIFETAASLEHSEASYFSKSMVKAASFKFQQSLPMEFWGLFKNAECIYYVSAESDEEIKPLQKSLDDYLKNKETTLMFQGKDGKEITKLIYVPLSKNNKEEKYEYIDFCQQLHQRNPSHCQLQ